MADKRLTILENMGKDQEITLMYDFYQALPQDSYLKRMLARFPAYAEQQIQDDFGMDPLETIDHNYKENSQQRKEIDRLEADLKKAQGDVETWKQEAVLKRNDLEDEKGAHQQTRERLHTSTAAYNVDMGEKQHEIRRLEAQAIVDRETIKDLKARLYDYIIKEQAGA